MGMKNSAGTHQNCEKARTGKITNRFGNMKTCFGKSGCPLAHRKLGCATADHQKGEYPEYLFF